MFSLLLKKKRNEHIAVTFLIERDNGTEDARE